MRTALYNRLLLFVDPRGIGLSTSVACAAFRNLKIHPDDPSIIQRCADQIGKDWQHFTAENSARDFEMVRQALGIAELDLYGLSYGTNLSAVYASRFPKHVRTLGLDGEIPLKTRDLFMPTHYAAMKRQLKQFCNRSGKCKTDEVLKALSWAAEDLRKAPRPLTDPLNDKELYPQSMQLDVPMLAGLATGRPELGEDEKTSSAVWRLPFISALLKAHRQKDWTALEVLAVENSAAPKELLSDIDYPEIMTLNSISTCQDWAVPCKRTSTIDQRQVQYKTNPAAYDREHPNAFTPFMAEEWGMRQSDLGYYNSNISCPVQKAPLPAQSDQTFAWPDSLPVLVLNADYDFQTVKEDAELAAAQFKKAQYARFKHHGHAILPSSLCAVQLLREFLDNKRVADPMKCYEADPAGVSLEKGKPKRRHLERFRLFTHQT